LKTPTGSVTKTGTTPPPRLQGSSFYKLPRILQWFSGNIGFHHIHHLSSRIPNYNLERCHDSHPIFQQVKPITLRTSLKSLGYRLWDEQLNKLVGYRRMREVRREQAAAKAAQDKKVAAVQSFENEGGHPITPEKQS
jgi:fatty acid desaturase